MMQKCLGSALYRSAHHHRSVHVRRDHWRAASSRITQGSLKKQHLTVPNQDDSQTHNCFFNIVYSHCTEMNSEFIHSLYYVLKSIPEVKLCSYKSRVACMSTIRNSPWRPACSEILDGVSQTCLSAHTHTWTHIQWLHYFFKTHSSPSHRSVRLL